MKKIEARKKALKALIGKMRTLESKEEYAEAEPEAVEEEEDEEDADPVKPGKQLSMEDPELDEKAEREAFMKGGKLSSAGKTKAVIMSVTVNKPSKSGKKPNGNNC